MTAALLHVIDSKELILMDTEDEVMRLRQLNTDLVEALVNLTKLAGELLNERFGGGNLSEAKIMERARVSLAKAGIE